MTASMIRTEHLTCSITEFSKAEDAGNGNVTIELAHNLKLACNRREDFERLKMLCDKALGFFSKGGESQ